MTSTTGKDRRQHERYDIASGGFALLRSDNKEVLGSIKDISTGGFRLSHIDDNEDIGNFSRITINLISGKNCYEQFNGRSIWSKRERGGFTATLVKMKQCGIEFEQLNNEMQLQLDEFINSLKKIKSQ